MGKCFHWTRLPSVILHRTNHTPSILLRQVAAARGFLRLPVMSRDTLQCSSETAEATRERSGNIFPPVMPSLSSFSSPHLLSMQTRRAGIAAAKGNRFTSSPVGAGAGLLRARQQHWLPALVTRERKAIGHGVKSNRSGSANLQLPAPARQDGRARFPSRNRSCVAKSSRRITSRQHHPAARRGRRTASATPLHAVTL